MTRATKVLIVLVVLFIVIGVVALVFMAGILTRMREGQEPVAAAVPVAAPAPVRSSGALERIRARGELRVIMDTGTPPWIGSPPMYFPNEAGEPDGFEYEVAQWVAKAVGVEKVKIVHALYEDFEAVLTQNQDNDVVIGGYVPYEAAGVAWSEPYLEFGLCLIVPAKSRIKTTDDLKGRIVGVYEDEAAVEEVNRLVKGYGGLRRVSEGYWDLLVSGGLDAYIYDYPFAVAEMKVWYSQNPHRRGSLRIVQYNLTDSTYNVAVRAGEGDLLAAVNQGIQQFRASEAYRTAIRKYLANDEQELEAPAEGARTYIVVSGDTLSKIAAAQLGDAARWPELWELNKARFPSPNLIEIGDPIVLP